MIPGDGALRRRKDFYNVMTPYNDAAIGLDALIHCGLKQYTDY